MKNSVRRLCWSLIVVSMPAMAGGAVSVVTAKSSLDARFRQMGVPMDAPFRRFSGSIYFDAKQPQKSYAHLVVQTGSFDLGQRDYDEQICKPEWFDCAKFPKARFDAQGLSPTGDGAFRTSGVLLLKGKRQRLALTLEVHKAVGGTVFEGEVPISRKLFSIGGPDWSGVVDDRVIVKFHIFMATQS